MLHPLDLHEIRTAIARHLPPKGLKACLQVSQAWHDSFAPILWRHLDLHKGAPGQPTFSSFQRYKTHIRHLGYRGDISHEFYYVKDMPLVTSLSFSYLFRWNYWILCAWKILDHTTTLRRLYLCLGNATVKPEIWRAVAKCENILDLLHIKDTQIAHEHAKDFWMACNRARVLVLETMTFFCVETRSPEDLSQVEELSCLWIKWPHTKARNVDLFAQCPNLRKLVWRTRDAIPSLADEFAAHLQMRRWPHLESASLSLSWIEDRLWAKTLESIKCGVNQVVCIHPGFGSEASRAIGRHLSTLCILDLRPCVEVTGPMIQKILSSSALLEEFSACRIHVQDIAKGDPWVCLNLKQLNLFIEVSPASDNSLSLSIENQSRMAFRELSKLTRLERLHLVMSRYSLQPNEVVHGLQLRLDAGLDFLAAMTRLQNLAISTVQRMEAKDARWIADNLRIRNLVAVLGANIDDHYRMKYIIQAKWISVTYYEASMWSRTHD